jgi:branched-chain amino acid transport system substrate-binding protein
MLIGARRALLLVAAVALVAAGCGNSGSDDSADDATPTTGGVVENDVGVTDKEVKVTLLGTLTGPNALGEAGFNDGFEAYVEALNAEGGVNGRTIKIVSTRDDASTPPRQLSEFQQAMEDDSPFLVVMASGNFAAADAAIEGGVPVVGQYTSTAWHKSDLFFAVNAGSWGASDQSTVKAGPPGLSGAGYDAYILRKKGETKMATFGYAIAGSSDSASEICAEVDTLGVDCAYSDTSLAFGFTDIGASLAKLKSENITHIYAAMDVGGCVTILRSLKRAGLDATLRCPAADAKTPGHYPDVADNLFMVQTGAPETSKIPGMVAVLKETKARKPGKERTAATRLGWYAGILLKDALTEMGDEITRENFVETIRTHKRFSAWDADGLVSPIDWTTNVWDRSQQPGFVPKVGCGFIFRGDSDARVFRPVGDKEGVCVNGIRRKGFEKLIDADTSKVEIS